MVSHLHIADSISPFIRGPFSHFRIFALRTLYVSFMLRLRVRVRVCVRVKIKVRVSSSVLPYCRSAFHPWPYQL